MKIRIDRNGDDVHMEVERDPMPPERFNATETLAAAFSLGYQAGKKEGGSK